MPAPIGGLPDRYTAYPPACPPRCKTPSRRSKRLSGKPDYVRLPTLPNSYKVDIFKFIFYVLYLIILKCFFIMILYLIFNFYIKQRRFGRTVQLILFYFFTVSKRRHFGGYKNILTPPSPFEPKVKKLSPPMCRDTHVSSHRRSPRLLHCLPARPPTFLGAKPSPRWSKRPSEKPDFVRIPTPPNSYKVDIFKLFFMFYI